MPHTLTIEVARQSLEPLGKGRQIAFGIFMLERAMPFLIQFQKETGWTGEGGRIRAALAQAWAALQSEGDDYLRFITEDDCDGALPDSEDFGSYVSAAIETVDLACHLLAFLKGGDVEALAECVDSRQDTIWMLLPEDFRGREASHPLLIEEVRFLDDDLLALQHAPVMRSELVTWVLDRIDANGYRMLRLP